ncbi:efflux RND transporter permease subunit [Fictibacillus sp. NRS-1165]|uniref:efflux RND transporter permease subunit n=1 Tax=Fictibacillus sp. NRS-1165 TaxID=3144463 RepID=UPI003D25A83C
MHSVKPWTKLIACSLTNGIVLIDKVERNRKEGMDVRTAVLNGTLSRVRPILMTAAATILTLLPLAFSHSGDTVISQNFRYCCHRWIDYLHDK